MEYRKNSTLQFTISRSPLTVSDDSSFIFRIILSHVGISARALPPSTHLFPNLERERCSDAQMLRSHNMDMLCGTERARLDSNPSTPEGPPVVDAEESVGINKVISRLTEMRTENANMAASVKTLDTKFTLVLTKFEKMKNKNKALRTENISMKEALFAMHNRQENLEVQSKS